MSLQSEFFIYANETEKCLCITRPESVKSTALSPCCMGAEDVDYEMSTGKNTEVLQICGMNQKGLEHFVLNYGKTYRYLEFFKCHLISDFSPLEDLQKLEQVDIYWNIRADKLWNMEKNTAFKKLCISDSKKIAEKLLLLNTSKTLESVSVSGSIFTNHTVESLKCFENIASLKHLKLANVRLRDKSTDALDTLVALERFDFDAGMFTTEEIAWLVAKYPNLSGCCMCAYNKEDAALNDVRVCGFRKPGLDLPKDQERLDKYVAEFNALVEQYKAMLLSE